MNLVNFLDRRHFLHPPCTTVALKNTIVLFSTPKTCKSYWPWINYRQCCVPRLQVGLGMSSTVMNNEVGCLGSKCLQRRWVGDENQWIILEWPKCMQQCLTWFLQVIHRLADFTPYLLSAPLTMTRSWAKWVCCTWCSLLYSCCEGLWFTVLQAAQTHWSIAGSSGQSRSVYKRFSDCTVEERPHMYVHGEVHLNTLYCLV